MNGIMNKILIFLSIFLIFSSAGIGICLSDEVKSYKKVSFEMLLEDPLSYDGKYIEVEGIYSGLKQYGPILYKDEEDFKAFNYRRGLFILNQSGSSVFVNVRHGIVVVVRGKFRFPKKNEANIYYADIVDIKSVVGIEKVSEPNRANP